MYSLLRRLFPILVVLYPINQSLLGKLGANRAFGELATEFAGADAAELFRQIALLCFTSIKRR